MTNTEDFYKDKLLITLSENLRDIDDYAERAIKEGWLVDVVVETKNSISAHLKRDIDRFLSRIKRDSISQEEIESGVLSLQKDIEYIEFKAELQKTFSRLKEEESLKESMKKYQMELELKARKEESESPDFAAKIEMYLREERRITCVDARELAEMMFAKLSKEEKESFFNQILYACYSNLGTPLFESCFEECVRKYQNSLVMQKVINDYLDEVTPERNYDEYEIDKLIELLPDNRKSLDDRSYQAYTAICWLKDEQNKKDSVEEVTPDDLSSKDVKEEFVAQTYSDISKGEPYSVAYRNGIEKAIGTVARQYGKVKAYPTHIADVASKSLNLGTKETLGDTLYKQVQENDKIKQLVREREEERELYEKKLEEQRKKIMEEADIRYKTFTQTDGGYRLQYPNGNIPYRNDWRNIPQQPNSNLSIKLIGLGINVILFLVCLLVQQITKSSYFLHYVGIGIATYGWIISPSKISPLTGQVYEPNRSRIVQTGNHRSQLKCVWFIVGGYFLFLLSLLLKMSL